MSSRWFKIKGIDTVFSISIFSDHPIWNRPPQDVDVLAVLDFQIPCYRPESPTLYLRSAHWDDLKDGNRDFKDPGRRHPEEPWSETRFRWKYFPQDPLGQYDHRASNSDSFNRFLTARIHCSTSDVNWFYIHIIPGWTSVPHLSVI